MQVGLLEAVEETKKRDKHPLAHRMCAHCVLVLGFDDHIAICGYHISTPLKSISKVNKPLCVVCIDLLESGAQCHNGHQVS